VEDEGFLGDLYTERKETRGVHSAARGLLSSSRQNTATEPVRHCSHCLENQPAVNVRQSQAPSAPCSPGRHFSDVIRVDVCWVGNSRSQAEVPGTVQVGTLLPRPRSRCSAPYMTSSRLQAIVTGALPITSSLTSCSNSDVIGNAGMFLTGLAWPCRLYTALGTGIRFQQGRGCFNHYIRTGCIISIAIGRGLDDRGGLGSNPHFSMSIKPALDSIQTLIQRLQRVLSAGIKWPEREANQSPPTNAEPRRPGSIYPPFHSSSRRRA
jgi:hypothetical protein